MKEAFYMPEHQENNPSFFCLGGRKTSGDIVSIKGFKLYVFSRSLGNFSAPYSVAAVPSDKDTSLFYSVEFSRRPDFEKFGFSVQTVNKRQVVFMSGEEIIKHDDAILLPGGDWHNNGYRYHVIGALHDIGIIPSLSPAIFTNNIFVEGYQKNIQEEFGFSGDLKDCLNQIFSKTLFCLEYFGFTHTKNEKLIAALKYSKQIASMNLVADFGCMFDFGTCRFATSRFHELGYPNRVISPEIITSTTYLQLINTIQSVSSMLRMLGYQVIDEDFRATINAATKLFQKKNKIHENCCGPTTLKTLIYAASCFNSENMTLAAGIEEKSDVPETFVQKRITGRPELSKMVDKIPDYMAKCQQLRVEIGSIITSSANSCDRVSERLKECEDSLNAICATIETLTETNTSIDEKLQEASKSLENVLDSHTDVEERIVLLNNKIATEERGNNIFKLISFTVIIILLYKFFSIIFKLIH